MLYVVVSKDYKAHDGSFVSPGIGSFLSVKGIRTYAHGIVIGMMDPYYEDFILSGGHVIMCYGYPADYDGIRGTTTTVTPTREVNVTIPDFCQRFQVAKRMVSSVFTWKELDQDGDLDLFDDWNVHEGTDGEKRRIKYMMDAIETKCKGLSRIEMSGGKGSAHFAAMSLAKGLQEKAYGHLQDSYAALAEACVLSVRAHSKLLLHQICEGIYGEKVRCN